MDEEANAARCSKRMRSVLQFVKADVFYLDVAVGDLPAIPRWHFARVLESMEGDSTSPRLGKALLAFYEKTCEIVRGENVVTENVIDREADPRVFKLTLYGALMRAYLYMAEKNSFACARLICGSTH